MRRTKIAINIDEEALTRIDRLVRDGLFSNRSEAFEVAAVERLGRMKRSRLACEAAKLDKAEERALAEEQYAGDVFIESEY